MRMLRMLIPAVFLLLLWCGVSRAETRVLLIGCDRFLTQQDTYPASHHNTEAMAAALSSLREQPAALVSLPDGLPSEEALSAAVDTAFGGCAEDDLCIFYISTHGLWEEGLRAGEFRLLLSDGVAETALGADRLKTLLDAVPARKLLILDACHSGAVIGRGVPLPAENLFAGDRYLVLCSSGGMEDSWYWSSDDGTGAGAAFFTDCLVRGISDAGNAEADENLDRTVTLSELYRYLLSSHGASCAQVYPEDCGETVFLLPERVRTNRGALLQHVCFESGALSIASPSISLSFTVLQPTRVAYRLIYQRGGSWDFAHPELIWDQPELPGMPAGSLEPGYKERTVTLHTRDEDYGEGYVLLQVLAVRGSRTVIAASTVLCVPPADGDPELEVLTSGAFDPDAGGEACILIRHALPCELSVRLLDSEGHTVARLMTQQPTRPHQMNPTGTTLFWNGRLRSGEAVPDGTYTVRVSALVGDEPWDAEDTVLTVSRTPPGESAQSRPPLRPKHTRLIRIPFLTD